jgi:hypothetical protein
MVGGRNVTKTRAMRNHAREWQYRAGRWIGMTGL